MKKDMGVLVYKSIETLEDQLKELARSLRALDAAFRDVQNKYMEMALYLTHLRGLTVSLNTEEENE